MKTLILIRHAKAANRHKHLSDIERPLTPRGEKEAKRVARAITARGLEPDQIISSPANRALETAHILAREMEYPIQKIALKQSIYDARDLDGLYATIRDIEDQYAVVLLVGHNPALEELASSLVAGFGESIPKAGIVQIQLEKDSWRDVLPGDGNIPQVEPEVMKSSSGPTNKEIRRDLNAKIVEQLTNIVNELRAGEVPMLESEIKKAADILARKMVKLHNSEEIG